MLMLFAMLNSVRFVKLPIPGGMLPINRGLSSKFKYVSAARLVIEVGIVPFNKLLPTPKYSRSTSREMVGEILPLKALVLRSKYVRRVKSDMKDGKVPLKALL